VSLAAGVNSGSNNFLDRLSGPAPGPNTISGFAVRDLNFNGVADNEPGLAGMVVTLRDAFNNPITSVTTNNTGAFSFSGLANGTYILTAAPPAGLTSTNAIAGQGGIRLGPATIRVTTSFGVTNYPGHLFLAGP
jgi:hypothetical protein